MSPCSPTITSISAVSTRAQGSMFRQLRDPISATINFVPLVGQMIGLLRQLADTVSSLHILFCMVRM